MYVSYYYFKVQFSFSLTSIYYDEIVQITW